VGGAAALRRPGRYQIRISGVPSAVSPAFRIAAAPALYRRLVANAVRYLTSERDGGDVVSSVLDRQPANLTDRRAYIYANPRYDSNDNLFGRFIRTGGPVDVSGGWFDAGGGYEKFGYTVSYVDGLMLMAAGDFPGRFATLGPEASFGLGWLRKLWNPQRKVLYIKVGIGNGNASNTIQGDYNFWLAACGPAGRATSRRSTPPAPATRTTWSAGPRSSPPPTIRRSRCSRSRSEPPDGRPGRPAQLPREAESCSRAARHSR
jgi:hypothetical protein